ncbi:hypothetical protein BX265_8387 [Streptomyces sp. TLI_235]|nr:cupin domain-containing protein [Streptomyces sp. TLI_235]PBC66319.1 hypothetical protein BX265_8387 [Streptomyces sp. TLI_235]
MSCPRSPTGAVVTRRAGRQPAAFLGVAFSVFRAREPRSGASTRRSSSTRWTAVGFTPEQLDQVHDQVRTVVLRAGQVLFIPRGWVHFGHTTAGHSLHITLGVQLFTQHWLLRQLIDQAAEDPELRAALPPELSSYAVEDLVARGRSALLRYLGGLDLSEAGRPVYMAQQRAVVGVGR